VAMAVCLAMVIGFAAPLPPAFGQSAASDEDGFVTIKGRDLVAPDGKVLELRGINLGGWLMPEGYMLGFSTAGSPRLIGQMLKELVGTEANNAFWQSWYRSFITEDDIRYIRQTGMNVIRVPFDYRLFTPEDYPGVWVGLGFELLDAVIGWSAKAGLYVILDMHAAPCGQSGTHIDNSYGYPHLYEDAACRARTAAIWRRIAEHYAQNRQVIGYDLLNEPITDKAEYRRLEPMLEGVYRDIAEAIREVDRNHILFLTGAQWGYRLDVFSAAHFDPRVAYAFHVYGNDASDTVVAPQLQFREAHDVPIFLGESGENGDAWIAAFRATLERNDIGWAFWTYKRMEASRSMRSFDKPPFWDELIAYQEPQKDAAASPMRPPAEHVLAALDGLLRNVRFANTRENAGYVEALGLSP
jgi:aryl-phospho-beta-D-glucosidase BglC (GH1 family)